MKATLLHQWTPKLWTKLNFYLKEFCLVGLQSSLFFINEKADLAQRLKHGLVDGDWGICGYKWLRHGYKLHQVHYLISKNNFSRPIKAK